MFKTDFRCFIITSLFLVLLIFIFFGGIFEDVEIKEIDKIIISNEDKTTYSTTKLYHYTDLNVNMICSDKTNINTKNEKDVCDVSIEYLYKEKRSDKKDYVIIIVKRSLIGMEWKFYKINIFEEI